MVLFLIAASPVSRQDKIYDTGGDAKVVGGYIILVSLLDTNDEPFRLLKPLRAEKYLAWSNGNIGRSGLATARRHLLFEGKE